MSKNNVKWLVTIFRHLTRLTGLAGYAIGLFASARAQPYLYATGQWTNYITQLNPTTGQVIRTMNNPYGQWVAGVEEGPDGLLYALVRRGIIGRYDPKTGDYLGDFIVDNRGQPFVPDITFGPDGNLYVTDADDHLIEKYDGKTGAYLGVFASDPLLQFPPFMTFGPDGDLYVSNLDSHSILRFDGNTGASKGEFAKHPDLRYPEGVAFGADGNMYVVSQGKARVMRFDGSSGQFIDTFIYPTVDIPFDLEFGPNGNLFVAAGGIWEYDAKTGQIVRGFDSKHLPTWHIAFSPVPEPATLAVLGVGFGAMLIRRRKRDSSLGDESRELAKRVGEHHGVRL